MELLKSIPFKMHDVQYELRPFYGLNIIEYKVENSESEEYCAAIVLEDMYGPFGYMKLDQEILDTFIKNLVAVKESVRIKNQW